MCLFSIICLAQKIERVEPPCWWTGMSTNLQLMVYGENISNYSDVSILEKGGIKVGKVEKADSPNYLFIKVDFNLFGSKPGEYTFQLTNPKKPEEKLEFKYNFYQRRENSSSRESFTNADLIYLLVPDRFSNGNPSNDNIEGYPDKYNPKSYNGRHGGDLRGIMNNLDYIASLGTTAIWSIPLTEDNQAEYSYHGYACSNYYKIDPRYGTNDLYKEYVETAHNKGIKIIMDVVTNHCGTAHWWMKDLPFRDWIHKHPNFTRSNYAMTTHSDPNASKKDLESCTSGWFDTSMPDMNMENPFLLQYFTQVFVWWIEWANIDGLRVDTYPYNNKKVIAEWTKNIRKEYKNISIVGEAWLNESPLIAYWEGDNKRNKDGYNSHLTNVMDFPLQSAFCQAIQNCGTANSNQMIKIYNSLANDFLYERPNDLLIFLDNHDTDRWADIVKQDTLKIKMGLALLATMRGIPQLYYGTEEGFISEDLTIGHGSARRDFTGKWLEGKSNLFNRNNLTPFEKEIYDYTCKLFNWRKKTPVLHNGRTMHFIPMNNEYSFVRYNKKNAVFVYANGSDKSQVVKWDRYDEVLGKYSSGRNVLNSEEVAIGGLEIVNPKEVLIVEF